MNVFKILAVITAAIIGLSLVTGVGKFGEVDEQVRWFLAGAAFGFSICLSCSVREYQ